MGALFGGRTGREKRLDSEFAAAFNPLIQSQTAHSNQAFDWAGSDRAKAEGALNLPLDFWTKAASGDRGTLMQLYAPELDTISKQTGERRQATSEFAPRGGRRSEMLGDLTDAETSQLNQILLGLRPMANEQLAQVAQLLFGVGQGELNASTGAGSSALQALLGNRGLNLQERQIRQSGNAGLGSLAGGLLGQLIMPGGFLNSSSSSASSGGFHTHP
jgi:hypothetical protein